VAVLWDPEKLEVNIGKHGIGFAEAALGARKSGGDHRRR
jgi:uncharacterized DUF497 family protein